MLYLYSSSVNKKRCVFKISSTFTPILSTKVFSENILIVKKFKIKFDKYGLPNIAAMSNVRQHIHSNNETPKDTLKLI